MNAESTVQSELHENEFENEKYTSAPQLHNNLKIKITIGRMNHSSFLLPNLTCASSAVKMKLLCGMMVADGYGTSDVAGEENEPMIMSVTYFADK